MWHGQKSANATRGNEGMSNEFILMVCCFYGLQASVWFMICNGGLATFYAVPLQRWPAMTRLGLQIELPRDDFGKVR